MWLLMFIFITSCAHQTPHTPNTFNNVTYVKNYDGDTVTFNIKGVHPLIGDNISVRLNGIDTAEMKTSDKCERKRALEAKGLVSSKLKEAERVDLKNVKRGKYFRIVADIIVDGESLGELLLKKNLAYRYDGRRKPAMDWCREITQ